MCPGRVWQSGVSNRVRSGRGGTTDGALESSSTATVCVPASAAVVEARGQAGRTTSSADTTNDVIIRSA